MSADGEFKRLMAGDRLCAAVLKAVRENDTAALRRLGLGGFAQYAGRLSELMTASVRGGLDWSPDFAALMRQVNSPVRYAHHLVNECGAAVQTALDERNGLRLRVVQPEYNDGRTKAIVGEAAESDSENAADNLATQLGTEVKDAGNVFLKQNAEQRSSAGFKVTVERTGGTNCCPWCADRIGRWELKDAPKDVFGVHDNCTCMVVYTNSRGVRSQRLGRSRFVEVNYEPKRLTDGEKRGAGEPKRLTGGSQNDIINQEQIAFIPAKTKQEAVDFAHRFANSVNYDGITLLNINQINEALNRLTQKYPIHKLKEITNNSPAVMSGNFERLRINGRKLGKTLREEMDLFKAEQEAAKKFIETMKQRYAGAAKIPWKIEKDIANQERLLKFKRHGVQASYKDHVQAVVTHEYGHIIADQYFGQLNEERANPNYALNRRLQGMARRWEDAYKKARETGDIYKLSRYGDKNVREFFAESFLAREMGEELPDYVESLMKEVLDNGIM